MAKTSGTKLSLPRFSGEWWIFTVDKSAQFALACHAYCKYIRRIHLITFCLQFLDVSQAWSTVSRSVNLVCLLVCEFVDMCCSVAVNTICLVYLQSKARTQCSLSSMGTNICLDFGGTAICIRQLRFSSGSPSIDWKLWEQVKAHNSHQWL